MNETNYHVRNNNCQEWVLIMLDKVDLLNLKNYTNIEEAQKLGMMTQIFGWAKSILSRNKDEQESTSEEVRPDIQTLMEIVEQKGIRPLKADGVLLPASVGSMNYYLFFQKYSYLYIISKKVCSKHYKSIKYILFVFQAWLHHYHYILLGFTLLEI